MSKLNLIIIMVFVCANMVHAQTCSENLEQAKRAYFNGNFLTVTNFLQPCIDEEWNQKEKIEALELLIKVNLIQLKNETADGYMKTLLTLDPLYEMRQSELIEFKNLFHEYEIKTRFNYGIRFGFNQQYYSILHYQSYGSNTQEPESYEAKAGLSAGLVGEYAITKNFFAAAEVLFQSHSYSQSEVIQDYQRVSITEKLAYITTPLQLQYRVSFKKFLLFAEGGLSLHYLLKAKGDLSLLSTEQEFPTAYPGIPRLVENYDLKSQRKTITANYVFGSGVRKSFGLTSFELAFHYEFGINNLVDVNKRYDDRNLYNTYSYVPDDFKMNHVRVTAGIFKTIAYPKKKKE